MADAGYWAFILGAFVIHPPKPNTIANRIVIRRGPKLAALEHTRRVPALAVPKCSSSLFYFIQQAAEYVVPANVSCDTIVRAARRTVNSMVCETLAQVTTIATAL
jgi:hypothetical protein